MMDKSDCFIISLAASAASFIFGAYLVEKFNADIIKYNTAIEQCEANLPRNQSCVITAIPEEKGSE